MKKQIEKKVLGKCVDYTFDGQGIVKHDSRVIFVPGLLKDEEAEIEIIYSKKDFDIGKITKITKVSPYRIQPKCKVATSCGGCCFMNLDYDEQCRIKQERVEQTISKITKIPAKIEHFYKMNNPYFYRNKIQVPFQYDKQRRIVYGFYKIKSHDVVYNPECAIQDKAASSILKTIQKLMIGFKLEPYNEDIRRGLIRHVLIRTGYYTHQVMVVLVTTNDMWKGKNNFIKELLSFHPEITTVVQNINTRDTNVILGDKDFVLYGKGYIEDYLLDTKFRISAKSFYQTNPVQTEKLYSIAIEKANLKTNDILLDAYCGIGTIGLIASKHCKKVVGVEIIPEAIRDAKLNAKINGIENVEHFCLDAADYTVNNKFDVVIVDPPRKGLDERFLFSLIKAKPSRIVYVSCDVATLARDLFKLKEVYNIESINCVDMFPHTAHVECCVSLSLKTK